MAARRQRLKVYRTELGFFETVVAAPNQKAALAAWGVHQDLFAEDRADVTTEAAATKPALAHPGTPLRRPVGSDAAFEVEPEGLPSVPSDGRRPRKVRKAAPDRAALDRAEKRLAELRDTRERQARDFADRQSALDVERKAAEAAFERSEREAVAALKNAERAYRAAGGKLSARGRSSRRG